MPPILSTSHCEFNGACSCTHARKTIPLAPIHLFTKQIVPSLCPESLTQSLSKSFSSVFRRRPIKCFLPSITNNIFTRASFFLCFISSHTLCACGSLHEPQKYFSNSRFVHSLLQWQRKQEKVGGGVYPRKILKRFSKIASE